VCAYVKETKSILFNHLCAAVFFFFLLTLQCFFFFCLLCSVFFGLFCFGVSHLFICLVPKKILENENPLTSFVSF